MSELYYSTCGLTKVEGRRNALWGQFGNFYLSYYPLVDVFTGTGVNDVTAWRYNLTTPMPPDPYRDWVIEIDGKETGPGGVDTFRYSKDGGLTWKASTVAITAGIKQNLDSSYPDPPGGNSFGIAIKFDAGTGHEVGDNWTFNYRTGAGYADYIMYWYVRGHLTLPAGTVWQALVETGQNCTVYVNGTEINPRVPSFFLPHQFVPLDLGPYLTPGAENIIAISASRRDVDSPSTSFFPVVCLKGHVIMKAYNGTLDGSDLIELERNYNPTGDGNMVWRRSLEPVPSNWYEVAYDDSSWQNETPEDGIVSLSNYDRPPVHKHWEKRDPAARVDGLSAIKLETSTGGRLFFQPGNCIIQVKVPIGFAANADHVDFTLYSQAANSAPVAVDGGGGSASFINSDPDRLAQIVTPSLTAGVYTITVRAKTAPPANTVIAELVYEPLVVVGAVANMGEVDGDTFEQGTGITLGATAPELTLDFTALAAGEWIEAWPPTAPDNYWDYTTDAAPGIVTTLSGLTYRQTQQTDWGAYLGTRFSLANPGDFYEVVIYYPDDEPRTMGFQIASRYLDTSGYYSINNNGKMEPMFRCGDRFPSSGGVQTEKFLFVPHVLPVGEYFYLNVQNRKEGGRAAIQKIEFYHIGPNLPKLKTDAGAVGGRHIGVVAERGRIILTTFGKWHLVGTDQQEQFGGTGYDYTYDGGEAEYLKWYYDAVTAQPNYSLEIRHAQHLANNFECVDRFVKYLQFMGSYLHVFGAHQYSMGNGSFDPFLPGTQIPVDFRDMLCAFADRNNIDLLANFEFYAAYFFASSQDYSTGYKFTEAGPRAPLTRFAAQIARRWQEYSSFKGMVNWMLYLNSPVAITMPPIWWSKWDDYVGEAASKGSGYDATTIAHFEVDQAWAPGTVLGATEDDRRDWIEANCLEVWLTWRCQEVHTCLVEMLTAMTDVKPGLELHAIYYLDCASIGDQTQKYYSVASASTYLRGFGMDPDLYTEAGMYFYYMLHPSQRYAPDTATGDPARIYSWRRNRDYPLMADYGQHNNRGAFLLNHFQETLLNASGLWVDSTHNLKEDGSPTWGFRGGFSVYQGAWDARYSRENFMDAIHGLEPDKLLYGWCDTSYIVGQEHEFRQFAKHFGSLPKAKFTSLALPKRVSGVDVRTLVAGGKLYFYLLNRTPIQQTAILTMTTASSTVTWLYNGATENLIGTPKTLTVTLPAFGMASFSDEDETATITGVRLTSADMDLRDQAKALVRAMQAEDLRVAVGGDVTTLRAAAEIALRSVRAGELGKAQEALSHYTVMAAEKADLWTLTGRPWVWSGPYTYDGTQAAFESALPVETDLLTGDLMDARSTVYGGATWATISPTRREADFNYLDLEPTFGRTANRIAVGAVQVYVATAQTIRLSAGSGGPIRVWVNGVLKINYFGTRTPDPSSKTVKVSVPAGWNTLVIKTATGTGWGAFAEVVGSLTNREYSSSRYVTGDLTYEFWYYALKGLYYQAQQVWDCGDAYNYQFNRFYANEWSSFWRYYPNSPIIVDSEVPGHFTYSAGLGPGGEQTYVYGDYTFLSSPNHQLNFNWRVNSLSAKDQGAGPAYHGQHFLTNAAAQSKFLGTADLTYYLVDGSGVPYGEAQTAAWGSGTTDLLKSPTETGGWKFQIANGWETIWVPTATPLPALMYLALSVNRSDRSSILTMEARWSGATYPIQDTTGYISIRYTAS